MIMEKTRPGPAFCDAAVPVRTKMPVPMIEPMPSAVRFNGPSARRSPPCSASSRSESRDFLVKAPIVDPGRSVGNWSGARLGSAERIGMGLAKSGAIGLRRQTCVLFEAAGKMALIAEPCGEGDVAQRSGSRQLLHGEFDAKLPHVGRKRR